MSEELSQTHEIQPSVREVLRQQCREMAIYALASGRTVEAGVLQAIESSPDSSPAGSAWDLQALTAAYASLCNVIKPATPVGVIHMAQQARLRGFWNRFGEVRIARAMSLCALIFADFGYRFELEPQRWSGFQL